MIKNVIFDLGDVVLICKSKNYLIRTFKDRLTEEEIEVLYDNTFGSNEWMLLDKGEIEKEKAIENMVRMVPEKLKDYVIEVMMNWKDCITINNEMIEFIKMLKEKEYNTYILSNFPIEIVTFLEENQITDFFDGMVISAFEHDLKPNDSIYQILLTRYNLIPNESLFIDDRKLNVEAAIRNGMSGYTFDYTKYQEFRNYIKENYNID